MERHRLLQKYMKMSRIYRYRTLNQPAPKIELHSNVNVEEISRAAQPCKM